LDRGDVLAANNRRLPEMAVGGAPGSSKTALVIGVFHLN
jgi:hypothetical protein